MIGMRNQTHQQRLGTRKQCITGQTSDFAVQAAALACPAIRHLMIGMCNQTHKQRLSTRKQCNTGQTSNLAVQAAASACPVSGTLDLAQYPLVMVVPQAHTVVR